MTKENFTLAGMWWLAQNTPLLIQLLIALVPVLALCVAGYALYAVVQKDKRDGK